MITSVIASYCLIAFSVDKITFECFIFIDWLRNYCVWMFNTSVWDLICDCIWNVTALDRGLFVQLHRTKKGNYHYYYSFTYSIQFIEFLVHWLNITLIGHWKLHRMSKRNRSWTTNFPVTGEIIKKKKWKRPS